MFNQLFIFQKIYPKTNQSFYICTAYIITKVGNQVRMSSSEEDMQAKKLASAAQASGEGEVEWYDIRQHVMARPDMYISSTTAEEHRGVTFRIMNEEKKSKITLDCLEKVDFKASISGAFLKYMDEIVTNAHDNGLRDATQKSIKIALDKKTGKIVVWNDGEGIEPTKFKDTDRYTISIIFGEYMSGTNLSSTTTSENESARLFAGGRNGYGISLVNTFSKNFIVETACPKSKTLYRQAWSENMSKEHPAKIKTFRGSNGYVKIECEPDWKLLGMPEPGEEGVSQSIIDALSRRAWDISTCSSLRNNNVSWCTSIPSDGAAIKWTQPLPIKSGQQFLKALFGEAARGGRSIAHDIINRTSDGLAIFDISVCSVTPEEGEALDATDSRVTAFVNGIRCSAGTHVRHATDRIVDIVRERVRSKAKRGDDMTIKPQHVQSGLAVCIVCLVADKSFDSQAKEKLTTPARSLGFTWAPSDKFKATLLDKTSIVESVTAAVSSKEAAVARKAATSNRSGVSRIAKYDPPASSSKSKGKKYLLITEGESAKSFVVAGASAIGRDFIGIYSLRGKVMNSRNNTTSKVQQNRELAELTRIMGLKPGETYTKEMVDALPFDHLVLVVDQDMDGSHIGGLIMWWFVDMYPSLLRAKPDYIQRFYTALVKATPSRRNEDALQFYSMGDYDRWARDQQSLKGFNIKYYKGLGTSTSEEAREYFKNYDRHLLSLSFKGDSCEKMMETFFDGKKTAERKQLLSACDSDMQIDFGSGEVSYETVVTNDLSHFAMYDTERAIPRFDGFKPGQRKAAFFFIDKQVHSEMKVAQAGAAVAQYTNYHHGEVSLTETIVGMAIEHVGTNNVPLFVPKGQFGSRLNKPSVHSAPRYIFTHLNEPFVGKLFRREDDPVLERVVDEGRVVEPKMYCGVVPWLLINGSSGIGTGWSTFIPPHNPLDVIGACKKIAHAGVAHGPDAALQVKLDRILPYYDGFKGDLALDDEGCLKTEGKWEVNLEESKLVITELPVGVWVVPYEEFIKEKLMTCSLADLSKKRKAGDDSGENVSSDPLVVDIFPGSSENCVRIELLCNSEQLEQLNSQPNGIADTFKLRNSYSTRNMWVFDEKNKLHKLNNAEELVWKHVGFRLDMYDKRKAHQIETKEKEIAKSAEILRFVELVVSGELSVVNRPIQDLISEVGSRGFARRNKDEGSENAPPTLQCFKYLLGIPLYSITAEKAQKLREELQDMQSEVDRLRSLTIYGMWMEELNELEQAYHEYKSDKTQRQGSTTTTSKKGWGKRKRGAKRKHAKTVDKPSNS